MRDTCSSRWAGLSSIFLLFYPANRSGCFFRSFVLSLVLFSFFVCLWVRGCVPIGRHRGLLMTLGSGPGLSFPFILVLPQAIGFSIAY